MDAGPLCGLPGDAWLIGGRASLLTMEARYGRDLSRSAVGKSTPWVE